ncbi:hypothetical protein N0V83_005754 [Neocucurbitaria cava]|uniref:F-box domain-containing protein n=1 Tax=Neocucurbitaria cava TaxID=798079 RepID=A0A9W8Y7Q7_9PLEO|nr:hypothetical protein N0V83_005754 [Neocucurbitaria cava]
MASLQQRSHLDRLPNELKLLIIENTRKRVDWKDLSLVSRGWALLVLPLLWDTFKGDLTWEVTRDRRLLADPTSNIAKYVRHLDIQDRSFLGSNLPTCLFAAIPKGQLRSFRCRKGASCIDNLDIMLSSHPGLTELSVAGDQRHYALKLSRLYLGELDFPGAFDNLSQQFDVLALEELTLDGIYGVTGLLTSMAAKFATGKPVLKKLRILTVCDRGTDAFSRSLRSLLESFQGLHQLYVECCDSSRLDVIGIGNHGATLKNLLIVNGGFVRTDASRCITAADVHHIVRTCPNLEQVCLNLYENDRTEVDPALYSLATLPRLEVLRLTNAPEYRKLHHWPNHFDRENIKLRRDVRRLDLQLRADDVMERFDNSVSNIKLLALSPLEDVGEIEVDEDGHTWPNYFYRPASDEGVDVEDSNTDVEEDVKVKPKRNRQRELAAALSAARVVSSDNELSQTSKRRNMSKRNTIQKMRGLI